MIALEQNLCESLALKVVIEGGESQGRVVLHYESLEQLDKILQYLGGGVDVF